MTILEKAKEAWNALTNTSGRRLEDHQTTLKNTPNQSSIQTPTQTTTKTFLKKYLPMKSYLKVKIKSLAEEATIIRHEERRVKRSLNWWNEFQSVTGEDSNTKSSIDAYQTEYYGLHNHRTYEVRNEARSSQLAYAFIQGYAYSRVEDPTKTRKPVATYRVAELALKYGKVNIPPETPYNKRRDEAEKIIRAWVEGKARVPVTGTNGQVERNIQPTTGG